MKKVIGLAIAVLIGVVFVASSHVFAAEINFSGEYRVRGYVEDFMTTKNLDNSSSHWDQRFRLNIDAVATDDLKGVVGIDIGEGGWGEAKGTGQSGDGDGVTYYLAYLDFNVPNTPLNVKMGTQTLAFGHSIIIDAELDSVVLSMQPDDMVTISGVIAKGTENQRATCDDEDYYALLLNVSPEENINIGVLIAYIHDGDASGQALNQGNLFLNDNYNDMTGYWLGLSADVAVEPLTVAAELDYVNRKYHAITSGTTDYKETGWCGYLNVGFAATDMVTVGSEFIYSTGNEDVDPNSGNADVKDEGFKDIANDFEVATWEEDIVVDGNVANAGLVSTWGVWGPRLYANITPMEELTLKAKMAYYWREEDPYGSGKGNEDDIGLELDGFMFYDVMENLKIKAYACYLFTDDDACGESAEDVWQMGQKVSYSF